MKKGESGYEVEWLFLQMSYRRVISFKLLLTYCLKVIAKSSPLFYLEKKNNIKETGVLGF